MNHLVIANNVIVKGLPNWMETIVITQIIGIKPTLAVVPTVASIFRPVALQTYWFREYSLSGFFKHWKIYNNKL